MSKKISTVLCSRRCHSCAAWCSACSTSMPPPLVLSSCVCVWVCCFFFHFDQVKPCISSKVILSLDFFFRRWFKVYCYLTIFNLTLHLIYSLTWSSLSPPPSSIVFILPFLISSNTDWEMIQIGICISSLYFSIPEALSIAFYSQMPYLCARVNVCVFMLLLDENLPEWRPVGR